MKVVFRVDSSAQLGSGHLMRCLTLAEVLHESGAEIRFICGDLDGNLNAFVQEKGILVTVLPRTSLVDALADAKQTILSLGSERPEWMVVDHYGLDVEWEQRLKPFVERLLVIDDHSGRSHDCNVLLDQNYSENGAEWYRGLIPTTCKMLLGPDFALLRKEFGELRGQVSRRKSMDNLLVFFTTGEDQGETLKAMRGIEMFGQAKNVDVVVGRANKHHTTIKNMCDEMHWGYHCQIDYMPSLIARADLVVGAGGSSNWERCALGVPALVTILARNQITIAEALHSAGIVCNLGWHHALKPADYKDALNKMEMWLLSDMSNKALGLVDTAGAKRVVNAMIFS